MAFQINWPKFSVEFLNSAREQLNEALNKTEEKPPNIVGEILVKELYMGSKAPELEIMEISDLSEERFKGIFKLVYSGDGYIVMQARAQANPLPIPKTRRIINPTVILAANKPFVVPMQIKISNLKLRGVVVLVVDKHKGVTLVFKNDPLEKVDVSSTFDNVPNIKRLLQRQIESQMRKVFQDDLPQMVHKLSVLYLQQKQSNSDLQRSPEVQLSLSTSFDNLKPNTSSLINLSPMAPSVITDEELIKRPHSEKWAGNSYENGIFSYFDPDIDESVVLHKNITGNSVLSPVKTSLGLRQVLDRSNDSTKQSVSRLMSPAVSADDLRHPLLYQAPTVNYAMPVLDKVLSDEFKSALEIETEIFKRENTSFNSAQLDPSTNETAAHLQTLFRVYHTLSPRAESSSLAVFRSSPRMAQSIQSFQQKSEKIKRKIIRFKAPFKVGSLSDVGRSSGRSVDYNSSKSHI